MASWPPRSWDSPKEKDRAPASDKFEHLLKSNLPPTEEEAEGIRDRILALKSQVKALQDNTRPCGTANWEGRIDKLIQDIHCYSSVLSVIRRLPMELVQEIFLFCTLSGTIPWTLSSICKDWRQYAFSSPVLWTSLHYVRGGRDAQRLANILRIYTATLHYSSNQPLAIGISRYPEEKSEETESDPVVALLASHSPRWESAYIMLHSGAAANLSPMIKGRLQSLKSLCLTIDRISHVQQVDYIDTFGDTPQLQSLVLWRPFHKMLEIKAPNLLSLTCNWPPPLRLSAVLQFTKLEYLKIEFNGEMGNPSFASVNKLGFPSLKHLIADLRRDHYFSFIQRITIPVITEVSFKLSKYDGMAHVHTMLMRSGQQLNPTIQRFQLRREVVPQSRQTVALLRLMPELRTLVVSMPHFDDINEFAKIDDPVHMLVPKLEACTFVFERDSDLGRFHNGLRAAIQALVHSRCELPPQFEASSSQAGTMHRLRMFELGGSRYATLHRLPHMFQLRRLVPLFIQADFEDWEETQGLERLMDLHDSLLRDVDCLYANASYEGIGPIQSVPSVQATLDAIECMNGLNPFDILISNLHIAVEKLTTRNCRYSDGEGPAPCPQADRIIGKWKVLISPYLDKVHWVYANHGSCNDELFLVYVRSDHPNRASEKMIDAVMRKDDDFLFTDNWLDSDFNMVIFD